MSPTERDPTDPIRFIEAMRQVPSVVTVVTTGDGNDVWGITIGSFVSLSISPPLISFNVQKTAAIHDPLAESQEYVVHVLRAEQTALSDLFARSDLLPGGFFHDLQYELTESGSPVLEDALVTFFCEAREVLPGGDHSIFVGAVADVSMGTPGDPVLYHKRAYFGVGDHLSDHD